jgi:hypothetical protein
LFDMEVNIDKTHVILCHVGGYLWQPAGGPSWLLWSQQGWLTRSGYPT